MKQLKTLYKRTSTGGVQEWTMCIDGGSYYSMEGMVGGTITQNDPHTCEAKNPGKKNATTAEEQAIKEAKAKWDKKIKKGYADDVKNIDSVTFRKPMKGSLYREYEDKVIFPVIVQDKLNGVRAQSDVNRTYSTGGETFHTIPHIREELAEIYADYPDAFIDSELFNFELKQHLNRLVKLVSVNIKPEHLTEEVLINAKEIVQLHAFDGYGFKDITPDTPYAERHAALEELFSEYDLCYVRLLPYAVSESKEDLVKRMAVNLAKGGEGLMIRYGTCPHKAGRSQYLLKLKHMDDDEFEIVDIQEGNAAWKGCAKRIVLKLNTPATNATKDETFDSNIEGSVEELRDMYQNKDRYISKLATVRYQCFSEYLIPQLPYVIAVRGYE